MSIRKAIGIDLGGTNLRVALVSEQGEVLMKIKESSSGDVMATLDRAIASMLDSEVVGIGIGVAGLIDREGKRVLTSPNIHKIEGHCLGELVPGLRVVVENDANAAAIGERWIGAGKGFRNFVLLTLGTGIGCGIVHDGTLLGIPAEAGHMSINASGERCACGNYGCLEHYCSARAITNMILKALEKGTHSLLRDYHKGNVYKITPEDVYAAAFEGDSLARETLREAGRSLGVGISNLINIFGPDAVILTGGLTRAWDIYIAEAIREASRRCFREIFEKVRIIKSGLGDDDTGIIGAAALILHSSDTNG